MNPPGKPSEDDPSGDVALRSDSGLVGETRGPLSLGSEPDLTIDLSPAPPEPAPPLSPAPPRSGRGLEEIPASFGRYEIRRALGVGGFGAVYFGHDAQLDRPVAVKVLRGGPDVPAAETSRF